jgi:hypothetical protein
MPASALRRLSLRVTALSETHHVILYKINMNDFNKYICFAFNVNLILRHGSKLFRLGAEKLQHLEESEAATRYFILSQDFRSEISLYLII